MISINNVYNKQIRNDWEIESLQNINEITFLKPCGKYDLTKIPNSVYKLSFVYKFENNPAEIPEFIREVEFYEYDYPLESLPTNITKVEINKGFNRPTDNLGDNFISINFGNNFNQAIDNLPSSLVKITLGKEFTYPINNLPENLKFIHLHNPSYDFTTILKLPKSLLLLQIGTNKDIDIDLDLKSEYFSKTIKYNYFKEKKHTIEFGISCCHCVNFYFFS